MASRFKTVTIEEVTKLKEAAENLNTRKSTIHWVRVFEKWCVFQCYTEAITQFGENDSVL